MKSVGGGEDGHTKIVRVDDESYMNTLQVLKRWLDKRVFTPANVARTHVPKKKNSQVTHLSQTPHGELD